MTNTFTPGPWKANRLPVTPGWMVEVHNTTLIATIEPGHSSASRIIIPLSEQEGNARLIAAAPELLTALEQGYKMLSKYDEADMLLQGLNITLANMYAAICKAKGESHV